MIQSITSQPTAVKQENKFSKLVYKIARNVHKIALPLIGIYICSHFPIAVAADEEFTLEQAMDCFNKCAEKRSIWSQLACYSRCTGKSLLEIAKTTGISVNKRWDF